MKETLKSIGSILLGLAAFIAVVVAIGLFFAFGTKVAFSIEPFINWLAGILLVVDAAALLLALSYKLRPFAGLVLFISSYVFGISVWIYGLAVTLSLWGVVALLIGLFLGGVGVVPIGMLAAAFHGEWGIFFTLLFTVALTYGTRITGTLLAESGGHTAGVQPTEDIIEGETADNETRSWKDLE